METVVGTFVIVLIHIQRSDVFVSLPKQKYHKIHYYQKKKKPSDSQQKSNQNGHVTANYLANEIFNLFNSNFITIIPYISFQLKLPNTTRVVRRTHLKTKATVTETNQYKAVPFLSFLSSSV